MRLFGNRPMDEVVPGLIGLSLSSGVLLWSIAWIAFGLTARAWPTAEAEILECRFEARSDSARASATTCVSGTGTPSAGRPTREAASISGRP